jgi:hypothetical protein
MQTKLPQTTANNNKKVAAPDTTTLPITTIELIDVPMHHCMSTPSVQDILVWWGEGGLEGGAARDCQRMPHQNVWRQQ